MPNSWDGKTERRRDPDDHDKLTRTLVVLENLVKNFDTHVEEDKVALQAIDKEMWKHAKYIYMGMGGIAVLEILLNVHK